MRIQTVEIENLFFKNHIKIPLHNKDRITILHGPNGSGKTTILGLLNSFFNLNFRNISKVPFGKLSLHFDNDASIHIYKNFLYAIGLDNGKNFESLKPFLKNSDNDDFSDEKFLIKIDLSKADNQNYSFFYSLNKNEFQPLFNKGWSEETEEFDEIKKGIIFKKINNIDILKELDEKNKKYYESFSMEKSFLTSSGELEKTINIKKEQYYTLSTKSRRRFDEMERIQNDIDNYEKRLEEFKKIGINKKNFDIENLLLDNSFMDSLKESYFSCQTLPYIFFSQLKRDIRPKIIESQRLKDITPRRQGQEFSQTRREAGFELVVNQCADDLKQKMKDANNEYNDISQQIDQTFPNRLMASILGGKKPDLNMLKDDLDELRRYQNHLTEFGVYKLEKDITSEYPIINIDEKSEAKMALALYSNDTKQKLAVYEKLDKMMIKFSSIISDLFLDKKIIFSQDQGFSFIDSDTNLELSLDKLSSGEQNIIVILYRLIFQIPENSLVLIDEPEISLHLGWQRSFLNILSEIIAINPMDIIISTHSPSIIADRRDLLVRIGKD